MRQAIVYIIVALAIFSLALTIIPHASAQTQNVKILTHTWYIDSLGLLVVVGEVQNTGPNTIDRVGLVGTAHAPDGTSVEGGTEAFVRYLTPNQRAPFYMEFYDQNSNSNGMWPASDVSNIDLSVVQANATQNYSYPDVKVQSSNGAVDTSFENQGVYWVTGTIKNTGSQTAKNVVLFGTFYNSAGTVVATGTSDLQNPFNLTASASANFKFGAWDLNQTIVPAAQKIASYSILVQTGSPILVGTAPIITPNEGQTQTPTPGVTDSSGGPTGFLPGQSPTSSSEPLSATTIIGIVVALAIIIVIVALLMVRKRKMQNQESGIPKRIQPEAKSKRERL